MYLYVLLMFGVPKSSPLILYYAQYFRATCTSLFWYLLVPLDIRFRVTCHFGHIRISKHLPYIYIPYLPYLQTLFFSSALCYCIAELLSSRGRPLSVRPGVVRKSRFSETVKRINVKIWGKLGNLSTISSDHLCFVFQKKDFFF